MARVAVTFLLVPSCLALFGCQNGPEAGEDDLQQLGVTAAQGDLRQLKTGTAAEAARSLLRLTRTPAEFLANYDVILSAAAASEGTLEAADLSAERTWRRVLCPFPSEGTLPRRKGILLWVSECMWWCESQQRQALVQRYIDAVESTGMIEAEGGDELWRVRAVYFSSFRRLVEPDVCPTQVIAYVIDAYSHASGKEEADHISGLLRRIAYVCPDQRKRLITMVMRESPDSFPPDMDVEAVLASRHMRELIAGETPAPVPVAESRYFSLHQMSAEELADVLARYHPPRIVHMEYHIAWERLASLSRLGDKAAHREDHVGSFL